MGEFDAGRWLILLLIYYAAEFIVIFAVLNAGSALGIPASGINAPDTGLFAIDGTTGKCLGSATFYCTQIDSIYNDENACTQNASYPVFAGCMWSNLSFTLTGRGCIGNFQGECSDFIDPTNCEIVSGCSWIDPTTQSTTVDYGSVAETFSFMFTFRPSYGTPSAYNWIFVFLFTILPVLMFVIALYFSAPIIH